MSGSRIPFNRPPLAGDEERYVREAIRSRHLSGDGSFTQRCSELLESELGVARALLTTSCTHALEMCALLLDLEPGDEFLVPSFAFSSTANAFALRGARPVFVDIRPDTLNLDEHALAAHVTPRTRAIVVLHYGGVGCEMEEIGKLAEGANLAVVEDNAHGLFASYRGRPLGSFGALATQSFHETKNLTCGEGGALLINRREWIERAEILREKGTDRSRFRRGEVEKYTWVDLGSSYLPSELLAAFLLAQLEARERIQARRLAVWNRYHEALADWAAGHEVGLPQIPSHCTHPGHLYFVVLPTDRARDDLLAHLGERGILAVSHYEPLHLSTMGRRFGARPGACPVTERVSPRLARLPLYADLTEDEQAEVIEAVRAFRPR